MAAVKKAMSTKAYTKTPELKPIPKSFTNINSKRPAKFTTPLINPSCTNSSKATATSAVTTAANQGLDLLRRSHRAWWQQEYYPSSFLSLGDTRLETFYWVCVASYTTASKACSFGV